MTIGINTKYYLKRLTLLGGVMVFLGGSAMLVDRTLAQVDGAPEAAARDEHVLSIHDRGDQRVVITKARTVREALKLANIEVSEGRDVIEPSLDEELVAQKYNINIYRARPVTVVDGLVKKSITTAEQTPSSIAKAAGFELYTEDEVEFSVAQDIVAHGSSRVMSIDRATPVEMILYGKKSQIRTRATTVDELLKEKNISLGDSDYLSVSKDQKIVSGMVVELWRDGTQTITVEEEVDFAVEQVQDANREIGYKEVRTPGEKGARNVTYEIEMKNGKEVGRKEIASVTTKEPKKQVEVVGTKNNYSGSLNEWLYALRMCETHGNYQTNTGNGFYGAYQFMPSTWNAIAKRTGRLDLVGILPSQASPADQDAMVIANANATSGLSTQHPGCYKKLGLSNKPPQ